ncbi:sulfotransferase family protein [Paracoccus shanxieyensis]|uniref:Sulfotransferase n=1 Tax=Paracoccus shanxieyensis TaxID=2675752 RepID=A0A6L6IZL2_9RHOB|nr:sulfotransferase [Paracoccus shanxieyensis]MTH64470.1 sulfotransferase [Paracoccus shanxieyensis]MTH87537.1 sulfotransferase [Paracoccus shanxieyensis]
MKIDPSIIETSSLVRRDEDRLVDFIVIGAMRAGTTMLQDILEKHPQISMARVKETDYFIAEKNYARGPDWYRGQFDTTRALRGEVSPNYAKARDFPGVPQRIFRDCPDARLIYVLRDPVKRAVSQYLHSWNMGEVTETPAQMAGGHEYFSIMDTSNYAAQLDAYLQYFDRSQILVIEFESLISAPQVHLDAILAHIGASPMQMPGMDRQNANDELERVPMAVLKLSQGRLRPLLTRLISPALRRRLRQMLARLGSARVAPCFPEPMLVTMRSELAPEVSRLRKMTGQEFSKWSI